MKSSIVKQPVLGRASHHSAGLLALAVICVLVPNLARATCTLSLGGCPVCGSAYVDVTNNDAHTQWIWVEVTVWDGSNVCGQGGMCVEVASQSTVRLELNNDLHVCDSCPQYFTLATALGWICSTQYECETYGCSYGRYPDCSAWCD